MATHSSTLAWKIPWTEEPRRLQSMGSLRVGHNWATSLSLFTFMHWRRKQQPSPVFLPGESQGRWSLVGCCLWGRTESDTTDATQQQQQQQQQQHRYRAGPWAELGQLWFLPVTLKWSQYNNETYSVLDGKDDPASMSLWHLGWWQLPVLTPLAPC